MPIIALFFITVVVSACLTYCLTRYRKSAKCPILLNEGQKVRLLTPSGAYWSHVQSHSPKGTVVSAPLYNNSFVPLRPGQSVVIQVPMQQGLATMHSEVVSRNVTDHSLVLSPIANYRVSERRVAGRTRLLEMKPILVNGFPGDLVDFGQTGSRFRTSVSVAAGDRVRLTMDDQDFYGWALGVDDSGGGPHFTHEVRVQFEDPVPMAFLR